MSPGGLRLKAPVLVSRGERIVAYIDEIGRVEGLVTRSTIDGFAIALTATTRKREKLTAALTFQANRQELPLADIRSAERRAPETKAVTITVAGDQSYPASLIDISETGAAAVCDARLAIGMVVSINGRRSIVVRSAGAEYGFRFADQIVRASQDTTQSS